MLLSPGNSPRHISTPSPSNQSSQNPNPNNSRVSNTDSDLPNRKRHRGSTVLDEDTYVASIEKIIERDFFPDIPKLQDRLDWLQAVRSHDPVLIRDAQLKILDRRRQRKESTADASFRATTSTPGSTFFRNTSVTPALYNENKESFANDEGNAGTGDGEREEGVDVSVSLDEFFRKYTSEDNESFSRIIEKVNRKKNEKYEFLLEGEKKGDDTENLIEDGSKREQIVTDGYGTSDQPVSTLEGWKYTAKNLLMYHPADRGEAPLTMEERAIRLKGLTKEIKRSNTRFHGKMMDASASMDDEDNVAVLYPPVAGATPVLVSNRDGDKWKKYDLDDLRKTPNRFYVESEKKADNGYNFVKTPSPAPGVDESPFITWGEIEGTPLRLEPEDTPIDIGGSGNGPQFKIALPPSRDLKAHSLSRDAARKLRERSKMFQKPPLPSPVRGGSASPTTRTLSPAAQKFMRNAIAKSSRSVDESLRASYRSASPGLSTPKSGRSMSRLGRDDSMTSTSPSNFLMDCSLLSSPFSSPNVAALLKIKIISWSQETGLPVSVCVRIADRTFNLHKHPLTCKSGYLKEKLNESNEVTVPSSFPGGPETFEMIALFMYGSTTLVDPFNVAALRCAAEFLQMTEDYGSGNLCERFDIYLNQVVLQSWDDTLIVLQKCRTLLPWAEELLIVSRCIETLAFMACMEILDPERRREHPVVTIKALAHQHWTNQKLKDIISHDLWIKDLIALPFSFFKRIIGSLRRQGMKEKYVSPIILFYVNKWILSSSRNDIGGDELSIILQGIIDLLPTGERASKVIPVYFYFHLLSKSLELDLRNDRVEKLQHQIASLLHLAQVEDFLLPKNGTDQFVSSCRELSIMESIVSKYVSSYVMESNHTPPSENNSVVAELWDLYLSRIATDLQLGCKRLMNLIETIPISSRQSHDHLYKTLNNFLLSHPDISQEEKGLVCKYLNCQKLSQQVCIEAVQNELMPLRLIVQALFVQQLNTQQAFRECSDSFRYANCGEFSGSLSSSRHTNSKTQNLGESPIPYEKGSEGRGSRPLSSMLQKDLTSYKSEFSSELPKKEYESTSFRIQNLENELMSLKRSLQLQQISKKNEKNTKKTQPYGLGERRMSKKKNPLGQVSTGCIGTVNFASQRNYANILFKLLQKISLFGRGRSKRKPGSAGLRSKNIQKTE